MKVTALLFVAGLLVGCGSGSSPVQDTGDLTSNDTAIALSDESTGSSNANQQGTDPLIQNKTTVTFDITVPAYQSNELRVEVLWGEITLAAQWVGDEFWQATGEFPTATEDALSITFFDNNGDLKLAVYSQTFETGLNAGETVQVSADQFDSNQFDDDADGSNNLAELLAGSDPELAETKVLPIKFTYRGIANPYLLSKYESSAHRPRPYAFKDEVPLGSYALAPTQVSSTNIEIDVFGNGSRFYKNQYMRSGYHDEQNASRAYTGSSVVWTGTDYKFNALDVYSRNIQFTVEASRIDSQSFRVEATFDTEYIHESRTRDYQNITYNLVAIEASGVRHCLADRGTYKLTWGSDKPDGETRTTTATKNLGDEYWHVRSTLNGSTIDEFLTTWVNMEVFCDYADID